MAHARNTGQGSEEMQLGSGLKFTLPALLLALPLAGVAAPPDAPAAAQPNPIELGRQRYMLDCATCHGVDGSGNGPVAGVLNIAPPDLTRIASRNHGNFSYADVFATIDGRQMPLAHGTRDMPLWGNRYKTALVAMGEKKVHDRVDAIVRYLETLQVP